MTATMVMMLMVMYSGDSNAVSDANADAYADVMAMMVLYEDGYYDDDCSVRNGGDSVYGDGMLVLPMLC